MKRSCLKISADSKPIKKYVITQVKKSDLTNIQMRKPKKKKHPLIFVIIALSILLIGSVSYNVIQYVIIQKQKNDIAEIEGHIPDSVAMYDEKDVLHFYEYDYETKKYLDSDGNEYNDKQIVQ